MHTCVYAHMLVLSKNVVITLCSASCNSLFVLISRVTAVKRMCTNNLKTLQPGVLLVQARADFSVYWGFCLLTQVNLSRMAKLLKICYKDKLLAVVSVPLGRYPQPWENMLGRCRAENVSCVVLTGKFPCNCFARLCVVHPKKHFMKRRQTMQMDSCGLIYPN